MCVCVCVCGSDPSVRMEARVTVNVSSSFKKRC